MIFGTPDFGASAGISCFLVVVWAIVLLLVLLGFFAGTRLVQAESPRTRKCGILLMVLSGVVPFMCCVGPPQVVRIVHGNYPIETRAREKI